MKPELERDDPAAGFETSTPTIEGDRTASPVGQDLDRGRGKLVILAVLLMTCALLIVFAQASRSAPKARPGRPAEQIVRYEQAPGRVQTPAQEKPPLPGEEAPFDVADASNPVSSEGESASASARPTQEPAAPLLVYAQIERPTHSDRTSVSRRSAGAPGGDPTELEALSQATDLRRLQASRLGDRNFLILAGASIPCVLQTALASSTPGYVTCILSNDVMSDTGAVILLEKGSRVLGEYRSSMQRGQARIFVLWTRVVSPGGVVIPLASPATDSLGRAGFDGAIDTHFWERFGGALVLSLIDAIGSAFDDDRALIARPSEAAATALSGVNAVTPTLRKDAGAEVMILVAHDLDFSSVYGLEAQP
jgi:type IV secretion system protein VirB10